MEAVHLITGNGISNRIVSSRDVSSCESEIVSERLKCDGSNEIYYAGRLGVFRAYDSNR